LEMFQIYLEDYELNKENIFDYLILIFDLI